MNVFGVFENAGAFFGVSHFGSQGQDLKQTWVRVFFGSGCLPQEGKWDFAYAQVVVGARLKPLFQADGVGSGLFQTEPGITEGSDSQFYSNNTTAVI